MKVWVVFEESRGMGASIIGVYTSREIAESVRNENGHCYIQQVILDE